VLATTSDPDAASPSVKIVCGHIDADSARLKGHPGRAGSRAQIASF
jgi:hypothetical protein